MVWYTRWVVIGELIEPLHHINPKELWWLVIMYYPDLVVQCVYSPQPRKSRGCGVHPSKIFIRDVNGYLLQDLGVCLLRGTGEFLYHWDPQGRLILPENLHHHLFGFGFVSYVKRTLTFPWNHTLQNSTQIFSPNILVLDSYKLYSLLVFLPRMIHV